MKRAMVVAMLVGLTAQANADNRELWRGVFAGSVTMTVGGLIAYTHGATKVADAEDELCARGAYAFEPGCATQTMLTQDELDRLNAKGDRGAKIATIGMTTTGVGVVVAGIAFYKGFIAKPARESKVAVTPHVARDGAGATLLVRW